LSCGKISLFCSLPVLDSRLVVVVSFPVCGCKVITFFAAVQIFLQQFFNKKVYSLIKY
jgi:hypothetical protein